MLVVQRRNGLLLLYAVVGHFEGEGSGRQLTQKSLKTVRMQTNQKKVQELHFEITADKLEMVVVAMMMMAIAMTVVVATEVMAMPLTEDRSKVEADCEGEYSLKWKARAVLRQQTHVNTTT